MALSIDDLIVKDTIIDVEGVKLNCKPPKMSHLLVLNKIGEGFKNISNLSREEIISLENDFEWVINDLIPELSGKVLQIQVMLDVITQIMEQVEPEENKELAEKGVKFDTDPKAEKIG
jgi:hypothetical protein